MVLLLIGGTTLATQPTLLLLQTEIRSTIPQHPQTVALNFREGSFGLKMYGAWSGWPNETSVLQGFTCEECEGKTYTLSGMGLHYTIDPVLASHTYGALTIKFFNADYSAMLGLHESDQIGATTEGDVWQDLRLRSRACRYSEHPSRSHFLAV